MCYGIIPLKKTYEYEATLLMYLLWSTQLPLRTRRAIAEICHAYSIAEAQGVLAEADPSSRWQRLEETKPRCGPQERLISMSPNDTTEEGKRP